MPNGAKRCRLADVADKLTAADDVTSLKRCSFAQRGETVRVGVPDGAKRCRLADVADKLTAALAKRGHRVMSVCPMYAPQSCLLLFLGSPNLSGTMC